MSLYSSNDTLLKMFFNCNVGFVINLTSPSRAIEVTQFLTMMINWSSCVKLVQCPFYCRVTLNVIVIVKRVCVLVCFSSSRVSAGPVCIMRWWWSSWSSSPGDYSPRPCWLWVTLWGGRRTVVTRVHQHHSAPDDEIRIQIYIRHVSCIVNTSL